jgi:nitric oxide reductase NorQ protein
LSAVDTTATAPGGSAPAGPPSAVADSTFYLPVGNEVQVFTAAFRRHLPIMVKGPTGCGKTRFVEAMSQRLGRRLYTVPGHEDLTSADLVGRYILQGGETVWIDGPLTRAVKEGAICYIDEIVEARQDATVVIHPLADHRRELHLERLGGHMETAAEGFAIVISYNPGYQSVLKDLKVSTRQRMVSISLDFPPAEIETEVVIHETGVDRAHAEDVVKLGQAIRRLTGYGLKEVASTRTLVATCALIAEGLPPREAAIAGIVGPLTDDESQVVGLTTMVENYL